MKPLDIYNYEKVGNLFNRAHILDVEALNTITRELKGETLKPEFYATFVHFDCNGEPNREVIKEYYFSALGEILAYDIDGYCHVINDQDEFLNYNLYEVFNEIDKAQE